MNHIGLGLDRATGIHRRHQAEHVVDRALAVCRQPLIDAVTVYFSKPLSPTTFLAFELSLLAITQESGRLLVELVLNSLEPNDPQLVPRDLYFELGGYRRRKEKTPNRNVATLFGRITLWRRGYRSWDSEGSIFPLEMLLGLNCSVTPGLVDWLGRKMADAGANQARVLELLRVERGVTMGVKRLRECTQQLADSMSELRQDHQVAALLEALGDAQQSRGARKPVLSVGRDGITLQQHQPAVFEVATAATVSVYDRAGKRLKTIYLAWPPELGQATMDRMLTDLLTELFARWHGSVPRLAYVTDAGSNETRYYQDVLRKMQHPRTGKRLNWCRVVDYYHVSERIWTMSSTLFGKGSKEANGWARRMLKAIKMSSGPSRVLHSAASHFHRRKLSKQRKEDFWKAYRYIQRRTAFLRYHEYASQHIPLGSGVTEAACKTVFTQRLKQSGMRWSFDGAKSILTLRTILLSKTWASTYAEHLRLAYPIDLRPYSSNRKQNMNSAA